MINNKTVSVKLYLQIKKIGTTIGGNRAFKIKHYLYENKFTMAIYNWTRANNNTSYPITIIICN